ncbi:MAG: reprolysin-like metallopeptidase [Saprospiraceae bacterium]
MRVLFSLFLTVLCTTLWGQKAPNHFQPISPDAVALPQTAQREFEPLQYSAFTLDYEAIVAQLRDAPREFSAEAKSRLCVIALPIADGSMEEFAMLKTSPMAPALEAQHPEILTLAGASLHTPGMQIRITVSPYWGLRAMIVRADKGVEYVQPVALGQNQYYMAYDPIHEPRHPMAGVLPTKYEAPLDFSNLKGETTPRFSPGEPKPEDGELLENAVTLKIYKFAVACTGEFSQDNGGTKDAVFAKVTEFTNMLNAIYERDVNIRLELIPESYDIIFLDPNTDPYTGTTVGEWMSQNSSAMFNVLGSTDKYDVGHVFARYIDGMAIGVAGGVCCTQSKGRGCSAWHGPPYGSEFFAIVGQEIGHMWLSGHTFNQCSPESQFTYESACEPGSGSTIMSYNGACGGNNVGGGGTALYYHACSIAEIRNFVENLEGATCGTNLINGNNDPIITTPYPDNLFIPISTPFELTGSAVDPDGDSPLTYSWDEMDLGPTTALGSPVGNSPAFRWFTPTTDPARTFPRIQTVMTNSSTITEVLPTYNRDYNFVLVARDNKPGGGGVGMDTVSLRSTTTAGPFLLSYPNLATTIWKVGEYQTVTWDVAGTANSLVNCKKVNIRLSTNGGLTNTVTLATGVANNGKACIQVPNNATNTARIRVEAADNVFFDISNASFKIEQPSAASFSLCAATLNAFACLPAQFSTQISTSALAGFASPVTLSATGLPNGATATFSPNPVPAGGASTLSISFPVGSPEATFDVTVLGTAGAATSSSVITLTTVSNDFSAFAPTAPANGASGVNTQPLLQWSASADATAYAVELATSPSFAPNTLVASQSSTTFNSFQVTSALTEGGVYYWRVRAKNDCGEGAWSATQVFVVSVLNCSQLAANDLPKSISANGTPTVESKITLLAGGQISDLNVKKVQGSHEYFKDLEVHLISPIGTDVLLWKDRCSSSSGNFNIGFDDGAGAFFSCPPPNNNAVFKSTGLLSTFNGENAAGVWTLRVKDNSVSSGGSLAAFELQICSNEATNPPLITVNNVLHPSSGNNVVVGNDYLKAEDSNNSPAQLTFTLVTVPQKGLLKNNGNDLQIGSQFTQADLDNGFIRYYDYGLNAGADEFQFVVSDGEGGMDTGTFDISPIVGTNGAIGGGLAFDLSPNPADAVLRLSLSEPLASDALVLMFNAAGQRVRSWTLGAGNASLTLQIADLPDGVYAVSIENEVVRGVRKVVLR